MGVLESPLTLSTDNEECVMKKFATVSRAPSSPLTMHTNWTRMKTSSRTSSPSKRHHDKVSVLHCWSKGQKGRHKSSPPPKIRRYCTIYDVHRANIWLLRWLLRQMIINMPYYACTGSMYYCQRTIKDLKWLLRVLLWAFWPDPRRLMVRRSQVRHFCSTTLAISYYLLRVQMCLVFHGGKGLSSTLTSPKSYRRARHWSKVLRRALYGYRGILYRLRNLDYRWSRMMIMMSNTKRLSNSIIPEYVISCSHNQLHGVFMLDYLQWSNF